LQFIRVARDCLPAARVVQVGLHIRPPDSSMTNSEKASEKASAKATAKARPKARRPLFDLDLLRAIVMVADCGTFTAASARLHSTQRR
jgi:hypothetical protein